MERTAWTDERIDDAFERLREEMREFRADMRAMRAEQAAEMRAIRVELFQLKLLMLGGYATLLAAIVALHG